MSKSDNRPVPHAYPNYMGRKWYVVQGRLHDGPFKTGSEARAYANTINDTLHIQDAEAFFDMERRHPGLPTLLFGDDWPADKPTPKRVA